MKKLLLVLTFCLLFLVSCGNKHSNIKEPIVVGNVAVEEIKDEVISAYVKENPQYQENQSMLLFYEAYQSYDGICFVFIKEPTYMGMYYLSETVQGYTFIYEYPIPMLVMKNDKFYELSTAYKDNIINKEHLEELYQEYKEKHKNLYSNTLDTLDLNLQRDIISAYKKANQITDDRCITIDTYYKEYNDAYAVIIYAGGAYNVVSHETVDGVMFNYKNSLQTSIYKDGNLYNLSNAFLNGILTHDDLVDLASLVNQWQNN